VDVAGRWAEAEAEAEKNFHWKHLAWLRWVAVVVAAIPLLPEAGAAGRPSASAWHPFLVAVDRRPPIEPCCRRSELASPDSAPASLAYRRVAQLNLHLVKLHIVELHCINLHTDTLLLQVNTLGAVDEFASLDLELTSAVNAPASLASRVAQLL
jgi:hypothetical protein